MSTLFLNMKKMYEYEMYKNVIPIAKILLTELNNDRSNTITPIEMATQHYLTLMYYGCSLFYERYHRKAVEIFRMALQARKTYVKLKSTTSVNYEAAMNQFTEIECRYKAALCLERIKDYPEALAVLHDIPNKQRPAKVNLLIAQIIWNYGYEHSPVAMFKAVLKECPLHLESIKGLLAYGVKITEVTALFNNNTNITLHTLDWLQNYCYAYCNIYHCKFQTALEHLKAIESRPDIGQCEEFQVLLGRCYYYMGEYDLALNYLQRVYNKNSFMNDGLMDLASVYVIKNRADDLEKLTQSMYGYHTSENMAEQWFVLAQHLYLQSKYEKAAFFAQKSCNMTPKNVEANFLKVKIFIAMKKYKEALLTLRFLEPYAFYRFEFYEYYVDAYIATNRLREAQEISRAGAHRRGPKIPPRSLVLLAKPFFHQDARQDKIKSKAFVTKALERDGNYLPAVYMLFEILQEEGDIGAAKKLIHKQLCVQPNAKLFSMLGDIYSKEKDVTKAVENYTAAINMDSSNRRAVAGLVALGQSMVTKTDSDAYSAPSTSDDANELQENAFERSDLPNTTPGVFDIESDSMWSDVEIDSANP